MALSEAAAAIVGAALGAGGAVAAQIVASIFTSRRERRRFAWEKEQAEAVRDHSLRKEQGEKFASERLLLYTAFVRDAGDASREIRVADRNDAYQKYVEWRARASDQFVKLLLLAPKVWEAAQHVDRALENLAQTSLQDGRGEAFVAFQSTMSRCIDVMRSTLGVAWAVHQETSQDT